MPTKNPAFFSILNSFYKGFFIKKPVGNNSFTFEQRKNKQIFVANIIEGDLSQLAVGSEIAFSEIVEGQQLNVCGLKNFVYFEKNGKNFFIFDNHNHAFFFWAAALYARELKYGLPLVHVDQHKDWREPDEYLPWKNLSEIDLTQAFDYTNQILNVGNFIKPAMILKFFSKIEMIDNRAAFDRRFSEEVVLDLDIDVFAPTLNYIPYDLKMTAITHYIKQAKIISIATSPFFMEQREAVRIVKDLVNRI